MRQEDVPSSHFHSPRLSCEDSPDIFKVNPSFDTHLTAVQSAFQEYFWRLLEGQEVGANVSLDLKLHLIHFLYFCAYSSVFIYICVDK